MSLAGWKSILCLDMAGAEDLQLKRLYSFRPCRSLFIGHPLASSYLATNQRFATAQALRQSIHGFTIGLQTCKTNSTFAPAEDRIILDGRAAGLSWSAISARLGTTGKACQYRLVRGLGVPDPKVIQVGRRPPPAPAAPSRPILPPGDAVSWGAITRGTMLEGRPFT